MPVHAYLAGAWRRAKVVWHWNGSAWVKATKVFIYDLGGWRQGYQQPIITSANGNNDTGDATYLIFDWTLTGDLYGAYLTLAREGLQQGLSQYPAEDYPTGETLAGQDPTGTWSVRLHDGNGDIISAFNVFFPFS